MPTTVQLRHFHALLLTLASALALSSTPRAEGEPSALADARRSAVIASHTLTKVQRWLHEAALPKIDPATGLYLSHDKGSGRYPKALWNYDDTAADTYPFLFWAAWYTDHEKIDGPIRGVLDAEQRLCNHLDRIPTAFDPVTLAKDIKTKDDLIFGASEYVKDGLIAIVEVAGTNNPWFERMRAIEDEPWQGRLVIDRPRHRMEMKFSQDWPRMNSMPEWFTAEPDAEYIVKDLTSGEAATLQGAELHAGVPITLEAGVGKQFLIRLK